MKKVTAIAKAIVTVEVSDLGSWTENADLAQVYRQASEEADIAVRHYLTSSRVKILGNPKITAILVERDD